MCRAFWYIKPSLAQTVHLTFILTVHLLMLNTTNPWLNLILLSLIWLISSPFAKRSHTPAVQSDKLRQLRSLPELPRKICEPWHCKTNKVTVRPANTQISLGICPVWSESSLCTLWVLKDPSFLHVDSEDFDQTGWMPRLIWVFAGHTVTLLVLSCRGSCVGCLYWAELDLLDLVSE